MDDDERAGDKHKRQDSHSLLLDKNGEEEDKEENPLEQMISLPKDSEEEKERQKKIKTAALRKKLVDDFYFCLSPDDLVKVWEHVDDNTEDRLKNSFVDEYKT